MVDYYNPYAKESYESQPTTLLISSKKTWLAHTFCYVLHVGLILVHVIFLLLWFTGLAHKVVIPIGPKSNLIATGIVQATTIVATIYIAGLLFISQQLATRRNLYSNQTLTATHDNLSSWTGLGASLVSVWHQRATAAAVSSSLIVAAYFSCLAILHITSPALVTVQAFNSTEHTVIPATLGPPNMSVANLGSGHQPAFGLTRRPSYPTCLTAIGFRKSDWRMERCMMSSLTTLAKVMLSLARRHSMLPADMLRAPQVTLMATAGLGILPRYMIPHFIASPIPVLAPNTFKWSSFYSYNLKDPFRHALFYTSADVVDSSGSNGAPIQLDSPMRPGAHMDASRQATVSDKNSVTTLQVIGCSVSLVNQSAVVDAQTHLFARSSAIGRKTDIDNERRQVVPRQDGSSTGGAQTTITVPATSTSQDEPSSSQISRTPNHQVSQDSTSSDPTSDSTMSPVGHPVPQTTTGHPVPQDSSTSPSTPSSSPTPEISNGRVIRRLSLEGITLGHPVPTGPPDNSNSSSSNSQFGAITYYEMDDTFLDVSISFNGRLPGKPWENPTGCNPLSVVEQYVMEDLGIYPTLIDSPDRPVPKITLHDLENTLASATAASYWAALYAKAGGLKESDPYNVANANNCRVAAMAGTASISYPSSATRLNVNLTPVSIASVAPYSNTPIGFMRSRSLTRPVHSHVLDHRKAATGDSNIDTVGILQILWLIRTRPDLQNVVSDVDEPTVDNLRKDSWLVPNVDADASKKGGNIGD
ncbi:hypothetical protein BDZ89DRAFT_1141216 [Hymenopellis radicata]|nr:hypothetical protein BDZ89DRAFT_1141216 [Hymenopellis radicata]